MGMNLATRDQVGNLSQLVRSLVKRIEVLEKEVHELKVSTNNIEIDLKYLDREVGKL